MKHRIYLHFMYMKKRRNKIKTGRYKHMQVNYEEENHLINGVFILFWLQNDSETFSIISQ